MNTDSESKIKLRKIIASTPLTEEQKSVWSAFIDVAKEDEVVPIMDVITSDVDALPLLTKNLTAKIEAMSKKDALLWGKIVQEEKAHLSGMVD